MENGFLPILSKLQGFLAERQIQAYLVGGFVRDLLLKRATADIDIAINADALKTGQELAAELMGAYVPIDPVNRISRVVVAHTPAENKVASAPAQLYIDLSTMEGDILGDLARRDFSLDALAVDLNKFLEYPENPDILDPFRGQADLKAGLIRAITQDVFKDDPARLMRAFRLAAETGFELTAETQDWIKRDAAQLTRVAAERIREELLKLLAAVQAGAMVRKMDDLGVLTVVIPELEAARNVEQPVEHHWDVLNHSIESVATAAYILHQGPSAYVRPEVLAEIPWTESLQVHFSTPVAYGADHAVLVKLAALLHDIAKPETKIIDKERVRFFGHNEQGALRVVAILERLRFGNREIRLVESMVRNHMRPTQMSHGSGMPSQRAIYRFFRDTGKAGLDTLFLSLADHLAARGPELDVEQWRWHLDRVKYILGEYAKDKTLMTPLKLVNGYDLMNEFGLSPGPRMREILESVREAQAAGEVSNRAEALSYIKNRLIYKKQN